MFQYDKKIDEWSQAMIKGHDEIWGRQITVANGTDLVITRNSLIDYLNDYTDKHLEEILLRLNRMTGLSYGASDIGLFINTIPVSLHNAKDKFISISAYHQFFTYPTVIIHELFHVYFCNYIRTAEFLAQNGIKDLSDIISSKEENELKEIVIVIINEEFSDLIDADDAGYPHHLNLRKELLILWESENHDFFSWVRHVIEALKKG